MQQWTVHKRAASAIYNNSVPSESYIVANKNKTTPKSCLSAYFETEQLQPLWNLKP
jgi:hypothetical protein